MFHRRRMVAPINSEKHYVQEPSFSVAASSIVVKNAVSSVQVQAKDAPNEVDQGSVVKAVWFEYWLTANDGTPSQFAVCAIIKLPSGLADPTATNLNNLNAYENKKNVLWTFEGLVPPNTQNPIPIIRQFIKIPKGKQRMGLGDKIVFALASSGSGLRACGFETYKEYK